jgi:hypothetical protein
MRPMDKGRAVPFFNSPSKRELSSPTRFPFQKGAARGRGQLLPSAFLLCHTCAQIGRFWGGKYEFYRDSKGYSV